MHANLPQLSQLTSNPCNLLDQAALAPKPPFLAPGAEATHFALEVAVPVTPAVRAARAIPWPSG
jgi:hypothetical protein